LIKGINASCTMLPMSRAAAVVHIAENKFTRQATFTPSADAAAAAAVEAVAVAEEEEEEEEAAKATVGKLFKAYTISVKRG